MDRIAAKKTAVTDFLNTYFVQLPMWDEITTAIAGDPTLVTGSLEAYMDVDLAHGIDYGRVHVWPAKSAPKNMGVRAVTLVQTIDQTRFVEQFVRAAQSLP
jgi:inosine-uridine nucleoside N-ribohydrolase